MKHITGYSAAQIGLHWAVFVLVGAQYIFKDGISSAWEAYTTGQDVAFSPLVFAHVAGGLLILALMLWRLWLRLSRGVPEAPATGHASIRVLGQVAHWGFYALLVGMAVTGGMAWFGGIEPAAQAHNVLKIALLALIVLHVLAVPIHKIVLKTPVMRRMIRPGT